MEISLAVNIFLATLCLILYIRLRRARKQVGRDAKTEILWFWRIAPKVEKMVRRSVRGDSRLAVAMVDLDHFKQVNDKHGHQFGDRILREFCQVILATLRPTDILARYGGEEFTLILTVNDGEENVWAVCERVRSAVAEHVFENGSRLTASIGFAFCPEKGTSLEGLVRKADEALYMAKASGRNRVESA